MLRANTVWHRADLCRKLTWLRRDTSCARRGSTMSQFLAKVEAIRNALGLRPAQELPAPLAISEAMVLMGIKANETWALPERVEALVEALDLPGFGKSPAATQAAAPAPSPAATQTAAPAPKPAATMPVPASAPSAKALGKQKSLAEEPQRAKSKQPKLYDSMACATKLQFNRRELDKAAAAQRAGEAIAYKELESKYSQPVVKFRSEITEERGEGEASASSGRTYECDLCLKSFDTAIGLRNHMQWHEKPHEDLSSLTFADHARLRWASRSRTDRRVQSSLPSARRRRRQVMRWSANQFSTTGRWWAGAWDRSWSATRMGARSRRLTVSE